MKKILGLDLGTNSIGWALIDKDAQKILGMGSRIIPMGQDVLGNFDKGNSISQTAERTGFRGTRRLRERHLLRRERLHRVLHILGFLPEHYEKYIDFEKRLGQFVNETEPKLAYNNCDFIFKKSFEEMVTDFKRQNPSLFYIKPNGKETKIPYDWTVYYLRKKALTQKIEKEEFVWIILNFNQKRGYYQLRGEEVEENPNKLVEFHSLKIIEVEADEKPNSKGDTWYSLQLENGWIYRRSSKNPLFDWKDKVRDFIVTTDLNDDGTVKTDKEGNERRSFRAPSEDDWTLLKKKTEAEIEHSKKTVGTYIYENLLLNPNQKIRGKLVRTIERKYYKEELIAILKKQIELQPELFSEDLYNDCVRELYRNNESHQFILSKKSFVHLFVNDIIFYQRPLRSQKSSISNCSLEFRKYKDKDKDKGGNEIKEYLKGMPKSHPLYQEFRLWQWMYNLKIYRKDDDTDVTSQFIVSINDKENLFDFLNNRKEIDQKALLKYFRLTEKTYRWNFVEDKIYPCNETGTQIRIRLAKVENLPANFLTSEIEQNLWHVIYSVTDKKEY
jgi:CRISPR-associated endonuclease Csn1